MKRQSLSTARAPTINTYGFLWSLRADRALQRLLDEGYCEFELMLQTPHLSLDPASPEAHEIGRLAKTRGCRIHALNMPSLDTNLASPTAEMRDYSVDMFRRQIRLAGSLGASCLVVAPGRLSPLFPAPATLLQQWMIEALENLLPLAREEGVVLAIENLPIASCPRAADLLHLIELLGTPPGLGICYDAANAHYVAEDPVDGILLLKDHLSLVHFSDTRRDTWRHDIIGQGDIGFSRICDVLDEIEWTGPLVLEIISMGSDPLEAIKQSHRMLHNSRHQFGIRN